jgi:uncharacterized repeat protein (TIGR01451 family)
MRRIITLVTLAGRRLAGDGVPFIGSSYARLLVLSATLTVAMVVGLLAYATSARAEVTCGGQSDAFCLEKTPTPDTVTVGEPLIFTIRGFCANDISCTLDIEDAGVTDTLPTGLEFVSASATGYGEPQPTCSESEGTVTCTPVAYMADREAGIEVPFVATIEVIPTQCGTFMNTASFLDQSVSETFTVEGCVPTTKAQCKNGGWRDYGYSDQGTCISAVKQNRP